MRNPGAMLILTLLILSPVAGHPGSADADSEEHQCLALTLYWEARAGGRESMIAVAWVVLNRRSSPEFPDTLCAVVRQGGEEPGCQFSYWCDGRQDEPTDLEAWDLAKKVAAAMIQSPPPDPTGGALFFHAADLNNPWSVPRTRTGKIGGHVFYR